MAPVTQEMLYRRKEPNCFKITAERKYYNLDDTLFMKRSLRPSEWITSQFHGRVHIPRLGCERLLNEAAAMKFVAENTDLPVPKLVCVFEDDQAVILITEYIHGVDIGDLTEEQQKVVKQELLGYLNTLHGLRSRTLGGPSGLFIPPYRVSRKLFRDVWNLRPSESDEFVFCHNDLNQSNVIVDPVSLKIKAIIDWEYAGFFPENFEAHFFERPGPSIAQGEEADDTQRLIDFLLSRNQ